MKDEEQKKCIHTYIEYLKNLDTNVLKKHKRIKWSSQMIRLLEMMYNLYNIISMTSKLQLSYFLPDSCDSPSPTSVLCELNLFFEVQRVRKCILLSPL